MGAAPLLEFAKHILDLVVLSVCSDDVIAHPTFRQKQRTRVDPRRRKTRADYSSTTLGAPDKPQTAPFCRRAAVPWAFRCVAPVLSPFLASTIRMRPNTPISTKRMRRLKMVL